MRSKMIYVRADEEEFKKIQQKSARAKLSVSEYIRDKVFDTSLSADDLRPMFLALQKIVVTYNGLPDFEGKNTLGSNISDAKTVLTELYHLAGR